MLRIANYAIVGSNRWKRLQLGHDLKQLGTWQPVLHLAKPLAARHAAAPASGLHRAHQAPCAPARTALSTN